MAAPMIRVELGRDRFSSDGVVARIEAAPVWFGPALRGAIMQGVKVLALDEFVEPWRESWEPSEVLWGRLQLLPLVTGFPPTCSARVCLRASNRLFSCNISRLTSGHFAISMHALTPRDAARDPVQPFQAGACVSVLAEPGPRLVITPGGAWTIDTCTAETIRYSASQADFRAAVDCWRGAMGAEQVLVAMQRQLWRLVEPAEEHLPAAWDAVQPQRSSWRAHRDTARGTTTFSRERRSELEEDDLKLRAALMAAGAVVALNTGAGVLLSADSESQLFVRSGADDSFLLIGHSNLLVFAEGPWQVEPSAGGLLILPFSARKDLVKVTGGAVYADPPSVRPSGDACWDQITLCLLRRGESVRCSATAALGVGTFPRWAVACGGVPVTRVPAAPGGWTKALSAPGGLAGAEVQDAWLARVEPVGQLTGDEILSAAALSLGESFSELAEAIVHAVDDRPPKIRYTADD